MTPDEIADRRARAVRAAAEAGRALGLEVDEPVVLHDVFSLVVHLAPQPVVARVPVVLPPALDLAAQGARQQRELDVVAWLAAGGAPVVPPSPLVPRRPVRHDGFSITFWERADVAADHAPYSAVSASHATYLHGALREYPTVGLGFLSPVTHTVPSLLPQLAPVEGLFDAADLDRVSREWTTLAPLLASPLHFLARFPRATMQAVHGDAPSYNVIRTVSGPKFADFEDVCLAPVEWDLALCTEEDRAAYDEKARQLRLRTLDDTLLRVMGACRMLQMVASVALVPQLPVLADGLRPALAAWRAMPFAGGVD